MSMVPIYTSDVGPDAHVFAEAITSVPGKYTLATPPNVTESTTSKGRMPRALGKKRVGVVHDVDLDGVQSARQMARLTGSGAVS